MALFTAWKGHLFTAYFFVACASLCLPPPFDPCAAASCTALVSSFTAQHVYTPHPSRLCILTKCKWHAVRTRTLQRYPHVPVLDMLCMCMGPGPACHAYRHSFLAVRYQLGRVRGTTWSSFTVLLQSRRVERYLASCQPYHVCVSPLPHQTLIYMTLVR